MQSRQSRGNGYILQAGICVCVCLCLSDLAYTAPHCLLSINQGFHPFFYLYFVFSLKTYKDPQQINSSNFVKKAVAYFSTLFTNSYGKNKFLFYIKNTDIIQKSTKLFTSYCIMFKVLQIYSKSREVCVYKCCLYKLKLLLELFLEHLSTTLFWCLISK